MLLLLLPLWKVSFPGAYPIVLPLLCLLPVFMPGADQNRELLSPLALFQNLSRYDPNVFRETLARFD
ncbi:MAG TPA: hypothetical protein VG101_12375 [Puia sp.]|jgi:hypothetical protein|nr:hypothetical protein [Puia sp.]